jgi:hypothetical protein
VSVTLVFSSNVALHVDPQSIPAGALVTLPVPEPARVTVSVSALVSRLKVAMTVVLLATSTVHFPVPVHAPDHPAKDDPDAGEAVSVMLVFSLKVALHVEPQLMPTGTLTTVPAPVPESDTFSFAVEVGETPKPPQPHSAAIKVTITLRKRAREADRDIMGWNP